MAKIVTVYYLLMMATDKGVTQCPGTPKFQTRDEARQYNIDNGYDPDANIKEIHERRDPVR